MYTSDLLDEVCVQLPWALITATSDWYGTWLAAPRSHQGRAGTAPQRRAGRLGYTDSGLVQDAHACRCCIPFSFLFVSTACMLGSSGHR
jgi:hypothetical protein